MKPSNRSLYIVDGASSRPFFFWVYFIPIAKLLSVKIFYEKLPIFVKKRLLFFYKKFKALLICVKIYCVFCQEIVQNFSVDKLC